MLTRLVPLLLLATCAACSVEPATAKREGDPSQTNAPASSAPQLIALPGGEPGIGFDDLRYSRHLGRVLVPGGRSGNLDLVDPATGAVTAIGGFGTRATFSGGHGDGPTSVDEGAGFLFVVDRTTKELDVVDVDARAIVARAQLGADPDYVRFVARPGEPAHEVWVTEPDAEQIEIFRFTAGAPPTVERAGAIVVRGGPESLEIDVKRRRAYTHLWERSTVSIDVAKRSIVAYWKNGCTDSRGIALDEERGFLFAGCAEGRAVVLDVEHDGKELARIDTASGVDLIAYDAARGHLYVPGGARATLTILGVSSRGELSVLGEAPTVGGAHCVTTDQNGRVYVGDPDHGRLLVIADTFAPSAR